MKRWLAGLAVLAAALMPASVSAHPLGNFTVNHYARIEPRQNGLRIAYVLDQAEIPTFQDRPQYSADPEAFADQRAAAIGANLHARVDGQPVTLRLESRSLSFPPGAGGLDTMRLEATFVGGFANGSQIDVRDDNDPTRIGWREIIATPADDGTVLQHSSVPAQDVTDALRSYPEDLLNSPLDVRQAHLTIASAGSTTAAASVTTALVPTGSGLFDRARAAFADLANADELTPAFVLFAIGVSVVLGAAHALQPGHGKTVVAAYLVGSRGTAWHAAFLGATVTLTHTAGVYALGLVTLALSQYILPERLYPVLEVGSGALVLGIGLWLLGQRGLTALGLRRGHHRHHPHEHDHDHHHEHGHDHSHAPRVGWRSLLALGISGGLLPCPEALMVLLITIAAHRVLFGLLLIVSFSTGLASVLVGFGLLLVFARSTFARLNLSSGLLPRLLPVASALVIVVAGGAITVQALPQVL
jgi:ABC-type nickel/cobalt efflux system permease component RcnA